jgi:hypothetical protein
VGAEIEIFEEDYLELVEESQVRRYKAFKEALLRSRAGEGASAEMRRQVFNFMGNAEVDMSSDKIQVSGVVGPVNIKSRLEHVTQTVQQAPTLGDDRREELTRLLAELASGLEAIAAARPEDVDRVAKTAELVVAEATKARPDRGFLAITVEGLKSAARAVEDIAPTVLSVALKVAGFVAALP